MTRLKRLRRSLRAGAMRGLDFEQHRSGENLVFIRRRPAEAPTPASVLAAVRD